MPLAAGQTFDAGSRTRNEVVISNTLLAARELWPEGNAIGREFRAARTPRPGMPPQPWMTVIGSRRMS